MTKLLTDEEFLGVQEPQLLSDEEFLGGQAPPPVETPAEAGKRATDALQYAVDKGVALEEAHTAVQEKADTETFNDFYAKMAVESKKAWDDPTRSVPNELAKLAVTVAEFLASTPPGAVAKQWVLRYGLDQDTAATYQRYANSMYRQWEGQAFDLPLAGRVNPVKMVFWDVPVFIENLMLIPASTVQAGAGPLRDLLAVAAKNVMRIGIAGGNTSAAAVIGQGGSPEQAAEAWGTGAAYSAAFATLFQTAAAAPTLAEMGQASLRSRALRQTTKAMIDEAVKIRAGEGSVAKLVGHVERGVELTQKLRPGTARWAKETLGNINAKRAFIKDFAAKHGTTEEQAWRLSYQIGIPKQLGKGAIPLPAGEAPAAPAAVPMMVTTAMKERLGTLGYTPGQIGAMTPAQAQNAMTLPVFAPPAAPAVAGRAAGGPGEGVSAPPPAAAEPTSVLPESLAGPGTGEGWSRLAGNQDFAGGALARAPLFAISPSGERITFMEAVGREKIHLREMFDSIQDHGQVVLAAEGALRDAGYEIREIAGGKEQVVSAPPAAAPAAEVAPAQAAAEPAPEAPVTPAAEKPTPEPPAITGEETGAMKVPTITEAVSALKHIGRFLKKVRGAGLRIVEPAKITELSLGKEVVADIYRGTRGRVDVARAEFAAQQLDAVDQTVGNLKQFLRQNYSPSDLENFTTAYLGHPTSGVAQTVAQEAADALPVELKTPELRAAIKEISDAIYDVGADVAEQVDAMRRTGPREFRQLEIEDWNRKQLGYFEDYFYGQWSDGPTMTVKDFFTNVWPTTDAWTKHKTIPSPADGVAYGLRLRHPGPIENLLSERMAIARIEGAVWERTRAYKGGEGVYVIADTPENRASHPGWRKLQESVFKDDLFHPDYAVLHDNLVSFNKVMSDPALSTFRSIANVSRYWKLFCPVFHEINTVKSNLTDFAVSMWRTGKVAWTPTQLAGKVGADPTFDVGNPMYRRYVEMGGSHQTSGEVEAKTQITEWAEAQTRQLIGSNAVNTVKWANFLKHFRAFLFDYQIPRIKFTSWATRVAHRERALGRELTPAEDQEIIKEVQAFYGEMNEALFGRSGTMTSALRLPYTAPGYSEGNWRASYDAAALWRPGRGAQARYYIPLALAMSAVLSNLITRIMAGYWKPWPKNAGELYDWFFFADTGYKDDKGRAIGANVGTYEKDFYAVPGNLAGATLEAAHGRDPTPELRKIPEYVAGRLAGMTSGFADVVTDFGNLAVGNAIYDYNGNRVMPIYDSFGKKALKLIIHELEIVTPIAGSAYGQYRERFPNIGVPATAFIALTGTRLTYTQAEHQKSERLRTLYAVKEHGEKLYRFLASTPRGEIPGLVREYRENMEKVINLFPESERAEWRTRAQLDEMRWIESALASNALSERTPEAKDEAARRILSVLTVKEK